MEDVKKFDVVSFMIEFESGEITQNSDLINGFIHLYNTGTLHGLQGTYGRTFELFVKYGHIEIKDDKAIAI